MVREIVKPAGSTYTLTLPAEMVGKTVEVIAFEIEQPKAVSGSLDPIAGKSLTEIKATYSKHPSTTHKGYQFDRDEANDIG